MKKATQPKKGERPKKRGRDRPTPTRNAFAYDVRAAQAMGAPGLTKIAELGKSGDLTIFYDKAGRRMITGESLRALLGIKEEDVA